MLPDLALNQRHPFTPIHFGQYCVARDLENITPIYNTTTLNTQARSSEGLMRAGG